LQDKTTGKADELTNFTCTKSYSYSLRWSKIQKQKACHRLKKQKLPVGGLVGVDVGAGPEPQKPQVRLQD